MGLAFFPVSLDIFKFGGLDHNLLDFYVLSSFTFLKLWVSRNLLDTHCFFLLIAPSFGPSLLDRALALPQLATEMSSTLAPSLPAPTYL